MNFDYRGVIGFDISTWQDSPLIAGHIVPQKMRDYGGVFCFVKASQGNFKDPDFDINWGLIKDILLRSPYHFYDNLYAPQVQARKFWSTVSHDFEGIAWLDLEDWRWGNYQGWRSWYDFLEELKVVSRLPPERIGIYTNQSYFTEFTASATTAQKRYFAQYPLWLAAYDVDPLNPRYGIFKTPFPWTDDQVLLLQTGTPAIGRLVGMESEEVDYNQGQGSLENFVLRLHGAFTPTPPPPPEVHMQKGIVRAGFTLTVRNSVGAPVGRSMNGGDYANGEVLNGRLYFDRYFESDNTPVEITGNVAIYNPSRPSEIWVDLHPVAAPSKTLIKGVLHYSDNTTETLYPEE